MTIQDRRWSTKEELEALEERFKPPYFWVKVWQHGYTYNYGPFFTMDLAEEFATNPPPPKCIDVVILEFDGNGYPP